MKEIKRVPVFLKHSVDWSQSNSISCYEITSHYASLQVFKSREL